jgi:hypothetical protein
VTRVEPLLSQAAVAPKGLSKTTHENTRGEPKFFAPRQNESPVTRPFAAKSET